MPAEILAHFGRTVATSPVPAGEISVMCLSDFPAEL